MTPETLAAILHRAGVGTWHNSVGPHHETHLEEARALLREPEFVAVDGLRERLRSAIGTTDESEGLPHWHFAQGGNGDDPEPTAGVFVRRQDVLNVIDAALQAEPARAEAKDGAAEDAMAADRAAALWRAEEGEGT